MKDSTKAIIMIAVFILLMVGFLILGAYRNHQTENGKLELVYQYGGEL